MRLMMAGIVLFCSMTIARAQEISVPFDSTGKVSVITSELESKLGLFQDFSGFLEARLYQASETEFYLEVLETRDSTLVRSRIPKTAEEVVALRRQVDQAIAMRAPESLYNHEGRAGLIVNSAILSAGFYGWAIPVATRMDGTATVMTYFLITAAGILGPALGTERTNVTRATAMMDFYGGSRGIAHGVALYYSFDPKEDSERAPYGWAVVTSLVERGILNMWATRSGMTAGKAAVIGVGGDFGTGLSAVLASGYDFWNSEHQSEAGLMVLGGSVAGMIAGTQLADHGHYTRGDGYVLRGIGFAGAALPAAIGDAGDMDGQSIATITTAGSLLALGLGHRLLRDVDFSSSQGLTVMFAQFGCAALAMVPVVASEVDDSGPYSLAAAIGGTAGFALGYSVTSKSARTVRKSADLDIEFNPLPLLTAGHDTYDAGRDHRNKQAITLTYRF